MDTITVSSLLRYASQQHGAFEKISEGKFRLVTRYGRPHVVLAPGNLAEMLSVLEKAEKRFNALSPEQFSAMAQAKKKGGLRAFIIRLGTE